ncbi:MAG: aldo/keto reductase [Chloroflexota bacterium]|nr:aldo/keto reductase [Chloroflexota bacterium]
MRYRELGKTGIKVSELGFGCGAVGGLLVKGDEEEMVRVIARAIDLGITYFDTAEAYGNGTSEANLGRVLEELDADVVVGTKVALTAEQMEHIDEAVPASLEASLQRLRRERVDLFQLHNRVVTQRQPERGWVDVEDVAAAVDALRSLQAQGKIRAWGINGLGKTEALHRAITSTETHTIQTCYNLLNPTSGQQAPEGFPFQDYGQLIDRVAERGIGPIAIRILAGGALTGTTRRHPVGADSVSPIATGKNYEEDVHLAQRFHFLVEEGYVDTLVEAAIRFAISKEELSTALIGISSMEQVEQAVQYVEKGPLPEVALARLPEVWATM